MDEFGTLTQSFGLKPQGKSAPMAASKAAPNFSTYSTRSNANDDAGFFPSSTASTRKSQNFNDSGGDYYSALHGETLKFSKQSSNGSSSSSFDYDSIFGGSHAPSNSSSLPVYGDDIFDSVAGLKTSASPSKPTSQIGDLLGDFEGVAPKSSGSDRKTSGDVEKNVADSDGFLIPGFGGTSDLKNGSKSSPNAASGSTSSSIDELEEFAMGKVQSRNENQQTFKLDVQKFTNVHRSGEANKKQRESRIPEKDVGKPKNEKLHKDDGGPFFSIDDALSSDATGSRTTSSQSKATGEGASGDDIESFFGMAAERSNVPIPRATAPDIMFDDLLNNSPGSKATQTNGSGASSNSRRDPSTLNLVDDFSFMFGVGATVEEFQEIEGESEERRGARLKRHQETKDRMARAVADMNQRDYQTQQEQEERHRISESVNAEIKQWAAGKEGNLRAQLSTLQCVLWPECGWQPVSLTDLITSSSVKKVYKKATLCVHPDKVQQKGANTRQRYIAEKVFDVLKEAWTKFNAEELR